MDDPRQEDRERPVEPPRGVRAALEALKAVPHPDRRVQARKTKPGPQTEAQR
jgi:hypothetical protein